jgi:hypothetical protein
MKPYFENLKELYTYIFKVNSWGRCCGIFFINKRKYFVNSVAGYFEVVHLKKNGEKLLKNKIEHR